MFPIGKLSADPGPATISGKAERWARNLEYDLREGTDLTGVGAFMKALGAHGVGDNAVANFMASLPLGLTRALTGVTELPQSGKRWQGTKDTAFGLLDAASIPGSFANPGELAGSGTEAVLDQAERAAAPIGRRLKNAFSLQAVQDALESSHADIQRAFETGTKAVQDDWHDTVRNIFDAVAKEAGVTPEKAESLRDVAANVSDAVKGKAQSLYKQADAAVGGTGFQSFQDAVKNIKNAIREEVGLDPDRDKLLQQRLVDAKAGHELAKEQLAAKGLQPGIIDTADALYRKAMALADVSKPIQSSISGLRGDLQSAGAAMESLSPAKLAARVNKLYDTGRLQQALGEGHSADFLTAIEETKQRLMDVANAAKQQAQAATTRAAQASSAVKTRRTVAGVTAGAALGSVPGYAILKHMLGL
jgi:hypothetical protein